MVKRYCSLYLYTTESIATIADQGLRNHLIFGSEGKRLFDSPQSNGYYYCPLFSFCFVLFYSKLFGLMDNGCLSLIVRHDKGDSKKKLRYSLYAHFLGARKPSIIFPSVNMTESEQETVCMIG